MKRLISLILAITLLVSILSACSLRHFRFDDGGTNQGNSEIGGETLTIGQWLGMVNNAFGMASYSQEEPYISTVDNKSEYFETVQIAAEWNVIDSGQSLNPNDSLLWRDALLTLVNVGNFTKQDATEDEKIDYGIGHFGTSIKKEWLGEAIDVATANSLLITAKDKWANREYNETILEVDYADNVKVFANDELAGVTFLDSNTISLSGITQLDFDAGDVILLPEEANSDSPVAYKVEDINVDNDVTVIKISDDIELGDVVDELYMEDTFSPDLTQAVFYDGNGNLVSNGNPSVVEQSFDDSEYKITNLAYSTGNSLQATPLAAKTTFEFVVDGCKVEVTMKSDGLSAKIEMPLSEDKKVKGYYEVEVSNFKVTNKIDYSWFTLHSAELKVDYQTKNTVGVKKTYIEEKAVYAPKWSNGNGSYLTNLKNSVWKDASSKKLGAKTIKIGSIKVASVGIASFSVDVYAKLKVDGSIEISFSETGCKGIEYKKGNCRVINTSDRDTDVKFKCKAEGTVSVVPTVNAFGFAIIGLKGETGLGAEASLTFHLVDAGNHLLQETTSTDLPPEVVEAMEISGLAAEADEIKKLAESQGGTFTSETSTVELHIDTCIDINVYFILRVGIEEETLAGKLLKGTKIKVTWELCGNKNAKICNLHIENFDFVDAFSKIEFFTDKNQCTMKYTPFDNVFEQENAQDETINNGTVDVGEVLVVSDMKIVVLTGTCRTISVIQIPRGYELKDIVCESMDTSIASIDMNGVITARSEGSTTMIVMTSDGKYSCACAVTVVNEFSENFTPLGFSVSTYEVEGVYAV